jgi:hypothetical protein
VPTEKGRYGEKEIIEGLENWYPEDEFLPLVGRSFFDGFRF